MSRSGMDAIDSYYNMSHAQRGRALVFNHKNFQEPALNTRTGTDFDRDKLESCLTALGFEVSVFNDLVYTDIHNEIRKVTEEDHTERDCVLIAVLSHAIMQSSILYASDTPYYMESLWTPFNGSRGQSLTGKPKLFFIQGCENDRNSIIDSSGLTVAGTNGGYTPNDFLMFNCAVPGFLAWGGSPQGSWFIQKWIEVLNEYKYQESLTTMMFKVNKYVYDTFEATHPDLFNSGRYYRCPGSTHKMCGLVYFEPK